MRRLLTTIATIAAAATFATGCSSSAEPNSGGESGSGGTTTLKVATIGLLSDGALQLGIKQGYFSQEGVTVQTSVVANPPAGLAAAQSGQVDVAFAPSIPLLNALGQGVPLKIIGAADGYEEGAASGADAAKADDTGLYASAKSGITDVRGLAGKTIAVPARKAQLEVTISGTLKDAGVDPASIKWVVLDFTSAVGALKNGTVDAAGLVSPFTTQAESQGDMLLASPSIQFFKQGAVGLWVAGTKTTEAKKDAVAAFQRAIVKSNTYANEHQKEAIQAGLDYTKSTVKVDQATVPYWPTSVRQEDIQRVDDQLASLGFLPKPVPLDGVIVAGQ